MIYFLTIREILFYVHQENCHQKKNMVKSALWTCKRLFVKSKADNLTMMSLENKNRERNTQSLSNLSKRATLESHVSFAQYSRSPRWYSLAHRLNSTCVKILVQLPSVGDSFCSGVLSFPLVISLRSVSFFSSWVHLFIQHCIVMQVIAETHKSLNWDN